jgi:hypothetical protein
VIGVAVVFVPAVLQSLKAHAPISAKDEKLKVPSISKWRWCGVISVCAHLLAFSAAPTEAHEISAQPFH